MTEHLKEEQITLKESVEINDASPPGEHTRSEHETAASEQTECERSKLTESELKQPELEQFPVVSENYKIVELIGHGGMGTVYKAINGLTGSTVAIKLFTSAVSKDKATLKRFEQETNTLANVDESNLLTIYESGESSDGAPYLVMEYIEGNNLAEVLTHNKVDETSAFPLFIQLCDLLSRAHRRGIIHRDIKPSNIIVSSQSTLIEDNQKVDFERVRIVDFGIARILDSVKDDTTKLTQTGAIFGTPTYMSPEQCQARETVDQRSDIYSLGCVMYEVLTGQPPFSGDNPLQVAMQHLNDFPHPISAKNCSKNLERIVMQCLAKDPQDRYKSVDDLREDLELVKQNRNPKYLKKLKTPKKKRPNLSVGMLFILIITVVIAYYNRAPEKQDLNSSQSPSTASGTATKIAKAKTDVRRLSAEIKLHPQDKFWYMKRAQAYTDLNKDKEAIADYTKVIELDPQDVHAYTNRGSSYMAKEAWDLSMKDEDKALSLSPNHVNAICTRAIVFMEEEDYPEALAECEKAIQLDPGRFDAYLTRGRVYMRTKEYAKALKEFDAVVRMEPQMTHGYWNRSQCYSELNQYEKSIADATKAIELDPTDPYLYGNRASIYLEKNHFSSALNDINKALQIDPESIDALSTRADYYNSMNQHDLAIADCSRAIELSPETSRLYSNRAYAYSKQKKYAEAIKDCNRALQLDKNNSYARELRDWCARFK
jgi:serine/threonine protein kinase